MSPTTFPGDLDNFTNPTPLDPLNNPSHSGLHSNIQDAVREMQKVIVGPSWFNVKSFGAKGNGSADDTAAIQESIDELASSGGTIWFPPGSYRVTSSLSVTSNNTMLVGWGASLVAGASMDNIVEFSVSSSRGSGGGITAIKFFGQGNADFAVLVDSWFGASFRDINGQDFIKGLFDVTAEQSASFDTNSENILIERIDLRPTGGGTNSEGLVRVRAGAGGTCSEVIIRDAFVLLLTGWAIQFEDVNRCTAHDVVAANNSADFSGVVRITNPGTAAGAVVACEGHVVINPYLENGFGSGTAVVVEVDSPAGATSVNRYHKVMWPKSEPKQRKLLNLRNTSTVAGLTEAITLAFPRSSLDSTGIIDIGVDVTHTQLVLGQYGNLLDGAINDAGTLTKVNQVLASSYGAGNTPTSSDVDVGGFVHNTDDNTLWMTTPDGVVRFLSGPTRLTDNISTSVGTTGGAAPPPATPSKYIKALDSSGDTVYIAAYLST